MAAASSVKIPPYTHLIGPAVLDSLTAQLGELDLIPVTSTPFSVRDYPFLSKATPLSPEEEWIRSIITLLSQFSGKTFDAGGVSKITQAVDPLLKLWETQFHAQAALSTTSLYTMVKTTCTWMKTHAKKAPVIFPPLLLKTGAGMSTSPITEQKSLIPGMFGTIRLQRHEDGTTYVMKTQKVEVAQQSLTFPARQFAQEHSLLASMILHPNVIQYYGAFQEGDQLSLVLEHADLGELFDLLSSFTFWEEGPLPLITRAETVAQGLIRGLRHLEQQNIVHRDLKPENVVLDMAYNPKIIDFGLAKKVPESGSCFSDDGVNGTPEYIPPEYFFVIHPDGHRTLVSPDGPIPISYKQDIWALGCMLFDLLGSRYGILRELGAYQHLKEQLYTTHTRTAFSLTTPEYLTRVIQNQAKEAVKTPYQCKTESELKSVHAIAQLVMVCLQLDPTKRPSISELIQKCSKQKTP